MPTLQVPPEWPWHSVSHTVGISWKLILGASLLAHRAREHTGANVGPVSRDTPGLCFLLHTLREIFIPNELWVAVLVCESSQWDSQISPWIIKCLLCLLDSYLQIERAAQLCGITANVIIVTDCIGIKLISLSDKILLQFCAADWEIQGAN